MRRDPALASLLKHVKYNCHCKCDKTAATVHFHDRSSSFRENGLLFSLACIVVNAKGITCNNAAVNDEVEHLGGHAD